MSELMTSPGDQHLSRDWWLENACRIAAFRLRQQRYISANAVPVCEQVKNSVEFVRIVWEEPNATSGGVKGQCSSEP